MTEQRIRLAHRGEGWRPAQTLPHGKRVQVITCMGLERIATRSGSPDARMEFKPRDKWGPERVHCWKHPGGGDLWAIGWKPL